MVLVEHTNGYQEMKKSKVLFNILTIFFYLLSCDILIGINGLKSHRCKQILQGYTLQNPFAGSWWSSLGACWGWEGPTQGVRVCSSVRMSLKTADRSFLRKSVSLSCEKGGGWVLFRHILV